MTRQPMNPEVKAAWLEALRSGDYVQGLGALCTEDENGNCFFCPLGVLSNLFAEQSIDARVVWRHTPCPRPTPNYHMHGRKTLHLNGSTHIPSHFVTDWAGATNCDLYRIAVMNDGESGGREIDTRRTFEEIADYIKASF